MARWPGAVEGNPTTTTLLRPGRVLAPVSVKVVPLAALLLGALFAGCLSNPDVDPAPVVPGEGGVGDVVVVAVIDSGVNPYHWDLAAPMMPQHQNDDPSDDLPLDTDPALWLPGFPGTDNFTNYGPLELTLDHENPEADMADMMGDDQEQWDAVPRSIADQVAYRWIPHTKVVGFVNFGTSANDNGVALASHGMGSASVSVGNIHGTCPECLLVFVNGPREEANEWVAKQDWIDAQTNSWGISAVMRDRMYTESDTDLQREAVDRGQSIFFSAGNGQANTFTVPNPTLFSSQEGPDWIITVGAIDSTDRASYTGHGKPADIANIGDAYPRAGGTTVTSENTFGGTSNATPVTAGLYAKALYELRKQMAGASRVQLEGIVSVGVLDCGDANDTCATEDRAITVHELREALFRSAEHTGAGWKPTSTNAPSVATTREMEFMAQGHGAYVGLLDGPDAWDADVERIIGFANGTWYEEQDPDLHDWMVADSFCRQSLWGPWLHGYFQGELPEPDAQDYPMRTWLTEDCPGMGGAIVQATKWLETVPIQAV